MVGGSVRRPTETRVRTRTVAVTMLIMEIQVRTHTESQCETLRTHRDTGKNTYSHNLKHDLQKYAYKKKKKWTSQKHLRTLTES